MPILASSDLQQFVEQLYQSKNWLFFGDRNAASGFIYRAELETLQE